MSTYRLLYFEPRPGVEWHVPVGAMVRDGSRTEAVLADLQPDARCLGGAGHLALLHYGHRVAASRAFFDRVPSELGDKFFLGEAVPLPSAVENASQWLRRHVLPQNASNEQPKQRTPKRSTMGRRYFDSRGVGPLVKSNFDVASQLSNARYLKKATHWVKGGEVTLLLEPIAPLGSALDDQVRDVYSRFSSYKIATGSDTSKFEFFAYLLSGPIQESVRVEMRRQIETVASLIDTGDDAEADQFVGRIRSESAQASSPSLMA